MTKKQVSICGYRYDICPAYSNNIDKLADRTTIRKGWSTFFGFDVPEDRIRCIGCRSEGVHLDPECPVRPCAREKHVDNCSYCSFFDSCDQLRSRADIIDELKKWFAGIISDKEYELFFHPYEGRNELIQQKKLR